MVVRSNHGETRRLAGRSLPLKSPAILLILSITYIHLLTCQTHSQAQQKLDGYAIHPRCKKRTAHPKSRPIHTLVHDVYLSYSDDNPPPPTINMTTRRYEATNININNTQQRERVAVREMSTTETSCGSSVRHLLILMLYHAFFFHPIYYIRPTSLAPPPS